MSKWFPFQIYWSMIVNWMKRKTFSFYFCSSVCVFPLLKRNKNIHIGFARINESIWRILLTYECKEKVFILFILLAFGLYFWAIKSDAAGNHLKLSHCFFFSNHQLDFRQLKHNAAKLFVCEDTWYNYNAVSDKIRAYGFCVLLVTEFIPYIFRWCDTDKRAIERRTRKSL